MSTVYPVGGTCKIVVAATEASATESANVQVDRFLALPAVSPLPKKSLVTSVLQLRVHAWFFSGTLWV